MEGPPKPDRLRAAADELRESCARLRQATEEFKRAKTALRFAQQAFRRARRRKETEATILQFRRPKDG